MNLILRSSNVVSFLLTWSLFHAAAQLARRYTDIIENVSSYSIYLKFHTDRKILSQPSPRRYADIFGRDYAPMTQTNLIYRPDGIRIGRLERISDDPVLPICTREARNVGARLRNPGPIIRPDSSGSSLCLCADY